MYKRKDFLSPHQDIDIDARSGERKVYIETQFYTLGKDCFEKITQVYSWPGLGLKEIGSQIQCLESGNIEG